MPQIAIKRSARKLSVRRRAKCAMTAFESMQMERILNQIRYIDRMLLNPFAVNRLFLLKRKIALHRYCLRSFYVDIRCYTDNLRKIESKNRRIDDFPDDVINAHFRFKTKAALKELLTGFQFPEYLRSKRNGRKFHREEVLLCGLYRLHFPCKFTIYTYSFAMSTRLRKLN